METDISILRKSGHFYFALTCTAKRPMHTEKLNSGFGAVKPGLVRFPDY